MNQLRIVNKDAWEYKDDVNGILCITTNGYVKKDGGCVMGAGIAKECKLKYPNIEYKLGSLIKNNGNKVIYLGNGLLSFPVKKVWNEQADLNLIEESMKVLYTLASTFTNRIFILPKPGCGNGHRDWDNEVKPIILKYYRTNIHIIDK